MSFNFEFILILVLIIWVSALSVFLWKTINHYNKLTKGLTDKSLHSVLENIIKDFNKSKKDIDFLKEYCDTLRRDGLLHIQKIGLVRFNPFKDTGGNQSFILCFVDGEDTGIVLSGLYSRSGTRWYAKNIVKGKSLEHELSDEEKEALRTARSFKKSN